jgi:hypothetical protein
MNFNREQLLIAGILLLSFGVLSSKEPYSASGIILISMAISLEKS